MKQRKASTPKIPQKQQERRLKSTGNLVSKSSTIQAPILAGSLVVQTISGTASLLAPSSDESSRGARHPVAAVIFQNMAFPPKHNATTDSFTNLEAEDNAGFIMLLIFFSIATVVGNTLLLICIFAEKVFRTSTNHFVASLTVASLMVGLLIMPIAIFRTAIENSHKGATNNQLSIIACEVWLFLDFTATTVIIFNIVCICIVRYLAIAHPLFYSRGHHRKLCILAPIAIWPISLLAASSRFFIMPYNSRTRLSNSRSVCTAGSSLDSAPFFVPISSVLFIVGNLTASIMLFLIRKALIKRANEVVERRYSMAVPSEHENGPSENALKSALQALRALPPPGSASDNNSSYNDQDLSGEAMIHGNSNQDIMGSIDSLTSDAQTKRRKWASNVSTRRKLVEQMKNSAGHHQHHNPLSQNDSGQFLGPYARRSDGSAGLDTIMSVSRQPSSVAVGSDGRFSGGECSRLSGCDNDARIKRELSISTAQTDKRTETQVDVNGARVIPTAAENENGKRQSVGSIKIPVKTRTSNPETEHKPPLPSSNTFHSSPKTGRRGSKPTIGTPKQGNFRKAERRMSSSEDQNQLVMHRPKSSSIYQRGGRFQFRQDTGDTNRLSEEQSVDEPRSMLNITQQLKSASSAMSLLVFEQLAGESVAKHIVSGRRGTACDNNMLEPRNSLGAAEKQRSRSLMANSRAATVEASHIPFISGSNSTIAGGRTRRSSYRSYKSYRSSRGLSMAIDGIVENFLSDGVKATANLIMLVLLFSICGLPSVVVEMVNFVCLYVLPTPKSCVPDSVLHMAMWMSFVYNALNPLVYFSFNQQLRVTLCRCIFKPTSNLRKVFTTTT